MIKWTIKDVGDILSNEALGNRGLYLLSSEEIEDEVLSKLWSEATDKTRKLDLYLKSKLEDDFID